MAGKSNQRKQHLEGHSPWVLHWRFCALGNLFKDICRAQVPWALHCSCSLMGGGGIKVSGPTKDFLFQLFMSNKILWFLPQIRGLHIIPEFTQPWWHVNGYGRWTVSAAQELDEWIKSRSGCTVNSSTASATWDLSLKSSSLKGNTQIKDFCK